MVRSARDPNALRTPHRGIPRHHPGGVETMNRTITHLEQRIATVESLIARGKKRVEAEPDNFAAALQLDSTLQHLADLRSQLRQARMEQTPVEVCQSIPGF